MKVTSWPNKLSSFSIILVLSVAIKSEAGAITTNKMRYATGKENYITSNSMPLEQVLELTAAKSDNHQQKILFYPNKQANYIINLRDKQHDNRKVNNSSNHRALDDEDRRLLEKFYQETKSGDPFLGDSLTAEGLWDEQEVGGVSALLDDNQLKVTDGGKNGDDTQQYAAIVPAMTNKGWTHSPEIIFGRKLQHINQFPDSAQASYSPPLRLLTSYNPLGTSLLKSNTNVYSSSHPKENRLVGATLFGQDKDSRPEVSSKSALEAVKLHDNLMKTPPKDGKVRIRMYYHRAIHDDKRLYGTGPWKYWGHGWGLEFGYDPKSEQKNKDFYQKGYTIERAFGRDFCLDKNNCRQPDPEFFKDPKNVGKYSEQATDYLLRKRPKFESERKPYQYRRV